MIIVYKGALVASVIMRHRRDSRVGGVGASSETLALILGKVKGYPWSWRGSVKRVAQDARCAAIGPPSSARGIKLSYVFWMDHRIKAANQSISKAHSELKININGIGMISCRG